MTCGASACYRIWFTTRNAALVEQAVWGIAVLGLVASRRAVQEFIAILGSTRSTEKLAPEDAWFARALQIWLFPFGLALVAIPLAQSYSVDRPELAGLYAMVSAILVWVLAVLEPRANQSWAGIPLNTWTWITRRPTAAMLAGYAAGAGVVAVPLYLLQRITGTHWADGDLAYVVVAAFLGCLLSLTYWECRSASTSGERGEEAGPQISVTETD